MDDLVLLKRDGDRCVDGEPIAQVRGRARTLLECERVALNFLQRLSGVATAARQFADRRGGHGLPRARYAQDHSGTAPAGEDGRASGRRDQSPPGTLRRGADQEQPHRGGGRGGTGHRAGARRPGCLSRSKCARAKSCARLWNRRRNACCSTISRRRKRPRGCARSPGAPRWNSPAAITLDNVRAYAETGADFVSVGRDHAFGAGDGYQLPAGAGVRDRRRAYTAGFPGAAHRLLSGRSARLCRRGEAGVRRGGYRRRTDRRPGAPWAYLALGAWQAGIYCSLALERRPVLTLALGLAAAKAIAQATGLACDLRWPNDLLLGGKKVAGILVQAADGMAVGGHRHQRESWRFSGGVEGGGYLAAPGSTEPRNLAREEILLGAAASPWTLSCEFDQESILRLLRACFQLRQRAGA